MFSIHFHFTVKKVSLGDDDDGYVFGSAIKEKQLRRRMNISNIVIDGSEQ
jgi:hypothetical protein